MRWEGRTGSGKCRFVLAVRRTRRRWLSNVASRLSVSQWGSVDGIGRHVRVRELTQVGTLDHATARMRMSDWAPIVLIWASDRVRGLEGCARIET